MKGHKDAGDCRPGKGIESDEDPALDAEQCNEGDSPVVDFVRIAVVVLAVDQLESIQGSFDDDVFLARS